MSADNRTVLICEDTSSIRKLLELFFKKRGFNTILAEDGVDAVALAREHAPDIIIMDIIMPAKDGIEAVRDLRQAGLTTPIIMMTSKNFAEDRERALGAGATVFLLKPFNPATLEETVRSLIPS